MTNRWYAGQLKPNGLAIARRNLTRQGIESFCPWRIETTRGRRGLRDAARPLFPGYVFVRLDPERGQAQAVQNTRGLTRLLRTGPSGPAALPEGLVEGLMARCAPDGRLFPMDDFQPGDRIRVISGPFADFVTRIESITPEARLQVLFDLMNRKVPVELEPQRVRRE